MPVEMLQTSSEVTEEEVKKGDITDYRGMERSVPSSDRPKRME
jgi:hypothetical protein